MPKGKRRDDAASRILRAAGNPNELDKILQDECRRRASNKLATTLLCENFRFPTALSAEQCTSDALAEFHASLIPSGAKVVDLTCGLAIDAFHIAKKAKEILCIDIDHDVAEAVGHNSRALGLTNVSVICGDCIDWLETNNDKEFDVAFIDPARRADDGGRLYSLSQCKPDVVAIIPLIFQIAPSIIIKASPMLDISKSISELPGVKAVHAVGTKSECKELLFELERNYVGPVKIIADTVGYSSLDLTPVEAPFNPTYADGINVGDLIGEPWPAVMKCTPRGLLRGVQLHPSTFLWKNPDEDFPGNIYKVIRIESFSSSNVRRLAKEQLSVSVATRNFPLTAEQLKDKLKSQESARCRLMATTINSTNRLLIFLEPVI